MHKIKPPRAMKLDLKRLCMNVMLLSILLVLFFAVSLFGSQEDKSPVVTSVTPDLYPLNANKNMALKPSAKFAAVKLPGLESSSGVKLVSSGLFPDLVQTAKKHPRKRKMHDLTREPEKNTMQTLVNTWTNGSYSPVHRHTEYSEVGCVELGYDLIYVDVKFPTGICDLGGRSGLLRVQ